MLVGLQKCVIKLDIKEHRKIVHTFQPHRRAHKLDRLSLSSTSPFVLVYIFGNWTTEIQIWESMAASISVQTHQELITCVSKQIAYNTGSTYHHIAAQSACPQSSAYQTHETLSEISSHYSEFQLLCLKK